MYRVKKQLLPESIQKLFTKRECQYNLRRIAMFKKQLVRINAKYHCISVKEVEQL